jgi:hypothetical protein
MAVRDVVQAAAGVGGGGGNLYVEDVFSTYLYTGNGSTQTITNGIDLAGEGGLVWTKMRNTGAFGNSDHWLFDTARGVEKKLSTNTTGGQGSTSGALEQFNSDGYQLGYAGGGYYELNYTGNTYASWSFRKAPKFFDVVTWSGNDVSGREIAHDLGSTPGCIIVKKTNGTYNWQIYHNAVGATKFLEFNTLQAQTSSAVWNDTAPTDSVFTVGNEYGVNQSGSTYVAYLFAHNAGGFGDDGTENVISCGSYTEGASAQDITLGYEPQWLLMKKTNSTSDWYLYDTMRGMSYRDSNALVPNTSDPEAVFGNGFFRPTATGFTALPSYWGSGASVIYIAIRRGPMKTPTDATKVFSPIARNGTAGVATVATTNLPDSIWSMNRSGGTGYPAFFYDRLRGANTFLIDNTSAETYDAANSGRYSVTAFDNLSYALGADVNYAGINGLTSGYSNWVMSRAPGFFDVVAYSGDSASSRNIAHNLSASPELIMLATRTTTNLWPTYHKDLPDPNPTYPSFLRLNTNGGINSSGGYYAATPTESVFTIGGDLNASDQSYIAYLFATLPGVSKVGSYTGTGADLNVDCGFSAGARFILIKRTDSTGDWYVWDSLRGIVSGNDPYLLLNSPAAEEPNTDYIDPLSSGFTVTSNASSTVNVDTGTYIFLAIA